MLKFNYIKNKAKTKNNFHFQITMDVMLLLEERPHMARASTVDPHLFNEVLAYI